MATAALRNLTASNVGVVAKDMVSLGAVRPLLLVFNEGTEQAQEHAAGVILNLAACHVGRNRIMDTPGASAAVVAMLRSPDSGTRERAAGTITNLGAMPQYQIVLAKEGAIPLLVQLLEEGSHRGREEAAVALSNLAINRQNQLVTTYHSLGTTRLQPLPWRQWVTPF
jgi:hypothetical protein